MGQEITVTARRGAAPSMMIFSCNRSITGMAIERVEHAIRHLFGYYGDEAGWSPDALRAIGVEPIKPPEPVAE
jgi:hypothetical protein